jgi:hypothetical protein
VANQESFSQICRSVCESQGWELLPTGIVVRWGDGRSQVVSLEFFEHEREDLVRLSTTIGDIREMGKERLTMALRVNAELAHGALAIKYNQLCMTDTLMLADTDPGELEAVVAFLARTADHYEETFFRTDEY